MYIPLFPTLKPKLTDPAWFNVDQPCDDEAEIAELEQEHQNWLNSIAQRNMDLLPIGKLANDTAEDEEDDEDEDDNDDDDESETHDDEDEDEIEMDGSYDHNSLGVNVRIGQGQGVA